MIKLFCDDNNKVFEELFKSDTRFDCIYCDPIYEDMKFEKWLDACYVLLKPDGVIFVQTDDHTVYDMKLYLDYLGLIFLNDLIVLNEWGGTSKRFFPRKHDYILFYANSPHYKFYPDRIQIPKVTAGTAFDKKGTGLKTPCDVFYDLGNFSTISKERLKLGDKNINWQKPIKLMNRILAPTTDYGDIIFEPFGGTFPACYWAYTNNRSAIGVEIDKEICEIGANRIVPSVLTTVIRT